MSAQLAYQINLNKALAGMLVNIGKSNDIVSFVCEANVDFGVVVSRGTDVSQAVAGGTDVVGISVRELTREGDGQAGTVQYSATETAAIMRKGYIYATCTAGCNPGDAVGYDPLTGVPTVGGTALSGATWESVAAAGELAVIRLNQ